MVPADFDSDLILVLLVEIRSATTSSTPSGLILDGRILEKSWNWTQMSSHHCLHRCRLILSLTLVGDSSTSSSFSPSSAVSLL